MKAVVEQDPEQRLLVIDDEAAILYTLREFFVASGYTVDCASEKEEAEAMLMHYEYSLALVDLQLTDGHGREGLDLVSFIRERRGRTRVMMLTGRGSPEIEVEARRRGADMVLYKPQPLGELGRLVSDLIETGR